MKKMSQIAVIFMLGAITSFVMNVAAEAVISSGSVSYGNTTVSTALDELFSAVDINEKIGTTDISKIGDGTITGAIEEIDTSSLKLKRVLTSFESIVGPVAIDISSYTKDLNVVGVIPVIYNVNQSWNVSTHSHPRITDIIVLRSDVVQQVDIFLYILHT